MNTETLKKNTRESMVIFHTTDFNYVFLKFKNLEEIERFRACLNKKEVDEPVLQFENGSNVLKQQIKVFGDGNKKGLETYKLKDYLDYEIYQNNIHYRNYNSKSRESWKKQLPFVSACEDTKSCFISILRAYGRTDIRPLNNDYKPFYFVIYKTLNNEN